MSSQAVWADPQSPYLDGAQVSAVARNAPMHRGIFGDLDMPGLSDHADPLVVIAYRRGFNVSVTGVVPSWKSLTPGGQYEAIEWFEDALAGGRYDAFKVVSLANDESALVEFATLIDQEVAADFSRSSAYYGLDKDTETVRQLFVETQSWSAPQSTRDALALPERYMRELAHRESLMKAIPAHYDVDLSDRSVLRGYSPHEVHQDTMNALDDLASDGELHSDEYRLLAHALSEPLHQEMVLGEVVKDIERFRALDHLARISPEPIKGTLSVLVAQGALGHNLVDHAQAALEVSKGYPVRQLAAMRRDAVQSMLDRHETLSLPEHALLVSPAETSRVFRIHQDRFEASRVTEVPSTSISVIGQFLARGIAQ